MAVSENTRTLPVARRRVFAALGLLAATPAGAMAGSAAVGAPVTVYRPEPHTAPGIALALADLRAAQADLDGIQARFQILPDDDDNPERVAAENALDMATGRFRNATLDMVGARATTFADMLAKAEALCLALLDGALYEINTPPEEQGEAHDRLAWSLARDILALGHLPAGRA